MLPLYSPSGRLLRWITEAEALGMAAVRITRNKRGHIVRADEGGQEPQRPIEQGNAGAAYEEPTSCGHIWALVMPRH